MATKKKRSPQAAGDSFADEDAETRAHELPSERGARTVIAATREERDTDEADRGEVLSTEEFGELAGVTMTDLPALAGHGSEDEPVHELFHGAVNSAVDSPAVDQAPLGLAGEARGAEALAGVVGSGGANEPTERRLTATLLKIFSRKREQIRLSLDQLAGLSGISLALLESFERPRPGQTITFDQVVVLARVLGIAPEELPGLRRREARGHLGGALAEMERALLAAPLLRYEGTHGERYGGDVERAAASKAFTVRIEDDSLSPALPRGAVLGFLSGLRPRSGGILLLRHRRSSLLAMRRYEPPTYAGLMPWQPSYVVGGEWHLCGSLEVLLPSR